MAIPVTLDDAKRQLKIGLGNTAQNGEIEDFIADAAAWVEQYTGHILVARDVTESFAGFTAIRLRAWPVKSDSVPIVTYPFGENTTISVTEVRVESGARPARVVLWAGLSWPIVVPGTTVTVTVRAGYEDEDVVPGNLRRAMLVLISGYDEGGEALVLAEATARTLCRDFRARAL